MYSRLAAVEIAKLHQVKPGPCVKVNLLKSISFAARKMCFERIPTELPDPEMNKM